jgi:glycoside/pentoside/hexuronide:cation symporter, GPH family
MPSEVAAAARSLPAPRLTTLACAGWGVGSLGSSLMFSATGVLLLRYLVDYVGIAAAVAGLLISLAKIYDAIADPFIGVVSDRTCSGAACCRPSASSRSSSSARSPAAPGRCRWHSPYCC